MQGQLERKLARSCVSVSVCCSQNLSAARCPAPALLLLSCANLDCYSGYMQVGQGQEERQKSLTFCRTREEAKLRSIKKKRKGKKPKPSDNSAVAEDFLQEFLFFLNQ